MANVNNTKGRKVVEFGFSDTEDVKAAVAVKYEDEQPLREIDSDTKSELADGTMRKAEVEVVTDSFIKSGMQSDIKPLIDGDRSESKDTTEQLVEEPGMLQPERAVGVIVEEIAQITAADIPVVKTE